MVACDFFCMRSKSTRAVKAARACNSGDKNKNAEGPIGSSTGAQFLSDGRHQCRPQGGLSEAWLCVLCRWQLVHPC